MTADTVGGVWTYAMELARALGEHGVKVGLATMGGRLSASQWAEANSLPNTEIFESSYKLEWMDNPWSDVDAAGEWLLKLEDIFQPDLVQLNNFCHGALPWRIPKIVVGHSCVLSWWRAVKRTDAPPEWDTYHRKVMEGLALSDLVIAPSRAMMTALEEHYGPFVASVVIPNGRGHWQVGQDKKVDFILAAGRLWDEAKNISMLAAVAPQLEWPVCVAGENHHPNGRKTKHLKIHYLGHLPQEKMRGWFERAAIYAAPARYEPFGLSVLEAALAGCALVLGDIPSLRENWGDAAAFVAPNDSAGLEATLRTLIENSALRRELSMNAQRAAARFTPEKMADNYLMAYTDTMERFQRGRLKEAAFSQDRMYSLPRSKGVSCAL
jgi:glycosyltransferase involved in cell wall biosynthesis